MAERQPALGRNSEIGDINEWMTRRIADVRQAGQNVDAAGREAYRLATRAGQNLLAMRPGDVAAIGARYLAQRKAAAAAPSRPTPTKPIPGRTAAAATLAPGKPRVAGRSRDPNWLDYGGKVAVGTAARGVGNIVGGVEGVGNTIKGLGEGAVFLARLNNPSDLALSPPGESAGEQVVRAGRSLADYARKGISNPEIVATDIKHGIHKFQIDTDPSATPMADTVTGELKRSFDIGKHQGEFVVDVAPWFVGGEAVKGLGLLGKVSKEARVAKLVEEGFDAKAVEHLAEDYDGAGHHFIPQRFRFPTSVLGVPVPKAIAGRPLPASISNSQFNVLKPPGISVHDFQVLHYKNDPHFYGAKLPGKGRGEGWSGKKLGLKKHGVLGRIWYGSPAPLKALVAGTAEAGDLSDDLANRDR